MADTQRVRLARLVASYGGGATLAAVELVEDAGQQVPYLITDVAAQLATGHDEPAAPADPAAQRAELERRRAHRAALLEVYTRTDYDPDEIERVRSELAECDNALAAIEAQGVAS